MEFSPSDIRNLRLRLGWTAAELGRRMGCTVRLVMDWESGATNPSGDVLNQLRYLHAHTEQIAMHVAQGPLAEVRMTEEKLAQVPRVSIPVKFL